MVWNSRDEVACRAELHYLCNWHVGLPHHIQEDKADKLHDVMGFSEIWNTSLKVTPIVEVQVWTTED